MFTSSTYNANNNSEYVKQEQQSVKTHNNEASNDNNASPDDIDSLKLNQTSCVLEP